MFHSKGFISIVLLILITIGAIIGLIWYYRNEKFDLSNIQINEPFQKQSTKVKWEEAIMLIKECKVKSASQTHFLEVNLILKDGSSVRSVEPKIDEISKEIKIAKSKCGEVLESSE